MVNTGIEPTMLLSIDLDADGRDEVLAADTTGDVALYRVLRWADVGWAPAVEATGPTRVDRLEKADLRGDGSHAVLYAEDRVHIASSPFEPVSALPADLGRLLAVVDANGDGRDDLLLAGPSPRESLILLVSR
jgi:hypothetical protein